MFSPKIQTCSKTNLCKLTKKIFWNFFSEFFKKLVSANYLKKHRSLGEVDFFKLFWIMSIWVSKVAPWTAKYGPFVGFLKFWKLLCRVKKLDFLGTLTRWLNFLLKKCHTVSSLIYSWVFVLTFSLFLKTFKWIYRFEGIFVQTCGMKLICSRPENFSDSWYLPQKKLLMKRIVKILTQVYL